MTGTESVGPEARSERLRRAFATETALFDAYDRAIRATGDRPAREAFLFCQAASAQARGRLMAELERQGASYGEDAEEIEGRIEALRDAEVRQAEVYGDIARTAQQDGDERLAKLARELVEVHERRRAALERLPG